MNLHLATAALRGALAFDLQVVRHESDLSATTATAVFAMRESRQPPAWRSATDVSI